MRGLETALMDIVQLLLWLMLFIAVMSRPQESDEVRRRSARLEQKVDAILQHLGITYEPPAPTGSDTVLGLIRAGKKIEAIKTYREDTGAGLKEAKEAVEAIEDRLRHGSPR